MQDLDLRPSSMRRLRGVDPVLLGSRTVMDAPSSFFYGARLPWPVVWSADVVVFAVSVMVLLSP